MKTRKVKTSFGPMSTHMKSKKKLTFRKWSKILKVNTHVICGNSFNFGTNIIELCTLVIGLVTMNINQLQKVEKVRKKSCKYDVERHVLIVGTSEKTFFEWLAESLKLNSKIWQPSHSGLRIRIHCESF